MKRAISKSACLLKVIKLPLLLEHTLKETKKELLLRLKVCLLLSKAITPLGGLLYKQELSRYRLFLVRIGYFLNLGIVSNEAAIP